MKIATLMSRGTDVVFGLLYVGIGYILFTTENDGLDLSSGATWIGLLIGFALLVFAQKIIKSVLTTVATAIDEALPKNE